MARLKEIARKVVMTLIRALAEILIAVAANVIAYLIIQQFFN